MAFRVYGPTAEECLEFGRESLRELAEELVALPPDSLQPERGRRVWFCVQIVAQQGELKRERGFASCEELARVIGNAPYITEGATASRLLDVVRSRQQLDLQTRRKPGKRRRAKPKPSRRRG